MKAQKSLIKGIKEQLTETVKLSTFGNIDRRVNRVL